MRELDATQLRAWLAQSGTGFVAAIEAKEAKRREMVEMYLALASDQPSPAQVIFIRLDPRGEGIAGALAKLAPTKGANVMLVSEGRVKDHVRVDSGQALAAWVGPRIHRLRK